MPLFQIAKLVGQLASVAPLVTHSVEKMRKLVEVVRNGDDNITKQLDALKQAIELQDTVNDKVEDQLRIMEAVLANVQQSLRILSLVAVATGILAIVAVFFAVLK